MIREGEFERRPPRCFKRMNPQKRSLSRAIEPLVPYRYAVGTGFKGAFADESRIIGERVKWCRIHASEDNSAWNQRFIPKRSAHTGVGELTFLFNDYATAMAFMLRWC